MTWEILARLKLKRVTYLYDLIEKNEGITVSEIARIEKVSRQTIHKQLKPLLWAKLLIKDDDSKYWSSKGVELRGIIK